VVEEEWEGWWWGRSWSEEGKTTEGFEGDRRPSPPLLLVASRGGFDEGGCEFWGRGAVEARFPRVRSH
jgi:hypothetical protein